MSQVSLGTSRVYPWDASGASDRQIPLCDFSLSAFSSPYWFVVENGKENHLANPPKTLGRKGKTLKKARNSLQKKSKEFQKSKERKIRVQSTEIAAIFAICADPRNPEDVFSTN